MDDKTRASADARFRKALRAADGPALDPQESEARSAAALTAKLKALRLERDAAEAASGQSARRAPVRKAVARKGVGSY
ncbi:MAG: hypothetical protein IT534_01560 [Bauldia sp.]|nr:hypothetical protein [Bauldia sp.]